MIPSRNIKHQQELIGRYNDPLYYVQQQQQQEHQLQYQNQQHHHLHYNQLQHQHQHLMQTNYSCNRNEAYNIDYQQQQKQFVVQQQQRTQPSQESQSFFRQDDNQESNIITDDTNQLFLESLNDQQPFNISQQQNYRVSNPCFDNINSNNQQAFDHRTLVVDASVSYPTINRFNDHSSSCQSQQQQQPRYYQPANNPPSYNIPSNLIQNSSNNSIQDQYSYYNYSDSTNRNQYQQSVNASQQQHVIISGNQIQQTSSQIHQTQPIQHQILQHYQNKVPNINHQYHRQETQIIQQEQQRNWQHYSNQPTQMETSTISNLHEVNDETQQQQQQSRYQLNNLTRNYIPQISQQYDQQNQHQPHMQFTSPRQVQGDLLTRASYNIQTSDHQLIDSHQDISLLQTNLNNDLLPTHSNLVESPPVLRNYLDIYNTSHQQDTSPPSLPQPQSQLLATKVRGDVIELGMKPNAPLASQEWLDTISKNLLEHMDKFGICVMDNFLGSTKGSLILSEVRELFTSCQPTKGRLVSDKLDAKTRAFNPIRSDQVIWIEGSEEGCNQINDLIQTLSAVVTNCSRLSMYNNKSEFEQKEINKRTKAMIARYPGGGSGYVKHVDNPNGDGRCITSIYYLNKDWNSELDGGLLRMFPSGLNEIANITPLFDRVLFFWSDRRNPHEVRPAHRTRLAITVWFIDSLEIEQTKNSITNLVTNDGEIGSQARDDHNQNRNRLSRDKQ